MLDASLSDNINDECSYSAKKEFGACNRKNTMATSNDESFTESNDIEFLYQEMKKKIQTIKRMNYVDLTSNTEYVNKCYHRIKRIANEDISTITNLNIKVLNVQ